MKKSPLIFLLLGTLFAAYPVDLMDRSSGLAGLACGGAGTARIGETSAPYWNPAGLAFNTKSGVEFTYYQNLGVVNHSSLDGVLLLDESIPIGLNFVQESIGSIPRTSEANGRAVEEGVFSDEYSFLNLATALPLGSGIYGGINCKFISHSILDYSASGLAADFGLIQIPRKNLRVGLTFRNVFSALDWSTGLQEQLARKLTLGAAYQQMILDKNNYFYADFDIYSEDELPGWGIGLESWLIENLFCLRTGVNSREEFTIGSGLYYYDFKFDLALFLREQSKQLENSVIFGLGFDFQMPKTNITTKPQTGNLEFAPEISVEKNMLVISQLSPGDIVEIAMLDSNYNVSTLPINETIQVPVVSGNYTLFFQLRDQQIIQKTITVN